MTKTKAILVAAFLATLVAGFAAGYTLRSFPRRRHAGPWLVYQLDLTPDQSSKIKAIWQEADDTLGRISDRGKALRSERIEAMRALLSGPQAMQYETIEQEYQRKSDELSQERRKAFEQAHAKTDAILTPAQRQKYEELMKSGPQRQQRHPGDAGKESPKPDGPKSGDQTTPHGGA